MESENVIDESGPGLGEECPICGSVNFVQEAGFFYCSVCNTQSQTGHIFVEDEYRFQQESQPQTRVALGVLRDKQRRKGTTEKVNPYKLSTWEIWNVILKEMADRLVEIGFPEYVRTKIFYLYVLFLRKRKVIFVSTTNPNARSRVSLGESKMNLYTLHGVNKLGDIAAGKPPINLRKKRKKLTSKRTTTEEEVIPDNIPKHLLKRRKTLAKRKAMEKDYLAKSKDKDAVDEHEFDRLITEETSLQTEKSPSKPQHSSSKPRRFLYTPFTKKLLQSKTKTRRIHTHLLFKPSARLKMLPLQNQLKFEHFSLSTCFVIVFVALREMGFPIVMTDVIRLYMCGYLHIDNIKQLLKKHEVYKDINQPKLHLFSLFNIGSTQHLGNSISSFVNFVQIKNFDYPKMKEIIPKYIDEFVLPREFECLVNLTNDMFSYDNFVADLPKMSRLEYYRALPEILVLVQFVVTLKMLFGFDDRTEKYQSAFARLVNQVIEKQVKKRKWQMEEWTELFVIEDWFKYLQRRKRVVRQELCSPLTYTPNNPPSMAKLQELMCQWTIEDDQEDDAEADLPRRQAVKSCREMFETIFKERRGDQEIPRLKPYLPLPLPTESVARQYVERYPLVADTAVKPELLSHNFVQKRLDFIWNPQKYARLLKLNGYNVKIVHGDAINNFPADIKEQVENSKTILIFQPYKRFDDFVGRFRNECSASMKFILGLCEDIIPGVGPDRIEMQHIEPLLQKLVNAVGDMYIKRVLLELVPVMTRWEESV